MWQVEWDQAWLVHYTFCCNYDIKLFWIFLVLIKQKLRNGAGYTEPMVGAQVRTAYCYLRSGNHAGDFRFIVLQLLEWKGANTSKWCRGVHAWIDAMCHTMNLGQVYHKECRCAQRWLRGKVLLVSNKPFLPFFTSFLLFNDPSLHEIANHHHLFCQNALDFELFMSYFHKPCLLGALKG